MESSARDALRAWFLGPRAENADLFERLVTETLRDHVFWRRNYHPEDGVTIREVDKRSPGYDAAVDTLTQELMGLLAALKRGVPNFSGRYKGHMIYQQTIAAQVGYFAAMLYNPNNVAIEASPVTTHLELEASEDLCRMIGYDAESSWGHLTSGGTVANFEALWIARQIAYLPVAIAAAARDLAVPLEVTLPGGDTGALDELGLWELLNVDNGSVLDLWGRLWDSAPVPDVQRAIEEHGLTAIGYQDFGVRLAQAFGDPLPPSAVLVASTAHYSWEKFVRALGIGARHLIHVPVDTHYRMDPEALWDRLREPAASRAPVMAVVSVCGTTEESAVDRLDLVEDVRRRAARDLGVAFHLHSDACYGGYVAAVTRRADGSRQTAEEIRESMGGDWPSPEWVAAMTALQEADSVTIDPHKFGYVPYPAGAILLRDRRGRDLVATDPPYLTPLRGLDSAEDLFLGRVHPRGLQAGGRRRRGVAQPPGAPPRRTRIRLPRGAHRGRSAAPCAGAPRGRPRSVPGRAPARPGHQHRLLRDPPPGHEHTRGAERPQ
jgi:hypothetical protein